MKRMIVLSAASLAFVAGSAWAGGGCNYGQKAAMASAEDATDEPIATETELSPELLALRKRLAEESSLDKAFVVPQNVPN